MVEETPSRPQPKVKKMPRRDPVEPSVPPAAERGRQPERLVPRAGSAASSSSRSPPPSSFIGLPCSSVGVDEEGAAKGHQAPAVAGRRGAL